MTSTPRHVSTYIERPMAEVYDYVSEPVNLPNWAHGLGSSVELAGGRWMAESPMGRVSFAFVARNEYGVLDHDVTLPDGQRVYNPMRVIADGSGCEVIFTVRRRPGMTEEEFDSDAGAVQRDLATLKRVLEP